ncbi:MAG: AI-2E family transporter [Coriobacteriia bacterium]|nr:AI-2E family transporter [Coriobacteriia bacterium]
MQKHKQEIQFAGVPGWLTTGGMGTLMLLLCGAGIYAVLYLIKISASISVPLILAFVVATVAYPLVKLGDKIHLPRAVSAALVVLLVAGVIWASVQIAVTGVVNQAPTITSQLVTGTKNLGNSAGGTLKSFGITQAQINTTINDFTNTVKSGTNTTNTGAITSSSIIAKIGSALLSGVSDIAGFLGSVTGFAFSVFIFAMLLYYFLADYQTIIKWIGDHLGLDTEIGEDLIEDASASLRAYFKGITLSAVAVALVIGVGLAILKVPLVIPIMIVTFITAYIPFIGAILASAFACLIALGSGGVTTALIVLVLSLFVQNIFQSFVNAQILGDSLDLHPLVVLSGTILGSIFAGLMGAMFAAPFLAILIRVIKRLRKAKIEMAENESVPQLELGEAPRETD